MIYEFERQGERIERSYPMGTAPRAVRVKGKLYKRVVALPRVIVPAHGHMESHSLPANYEPARLAGASFNPKNGRVRFTNRTQVLETVRIAKKMGEPLTYDEFDTPTASDLKGPEG